MIYSESFDALPDAAKEYVLRRLWDVLNGKDQSKEFAHLSAADRRAILDILRATKKDLPKYWLALGTSCRVWRRAKGKGEGLAALGRRSYC